jgi:predicted dehydrogenase
VRNFQAIEDCELVAVCDAREERLKLAHKAAKDVRLVSDAQEILSDPGINAVVIATPVAAHFELARQALENGKDVLCEKPLAITAQECRTLCELATRHQRILMVGHVFLYNPGVEHLKAGFDKGELGRVYYMDAVRTNLGPIRHDVGALHDLASHDISIFNHLLGSAPLEVSATGGFFLNSQVEDIGFLTLNYPNGVVCHVHTSWLNPRKVRQLTIVGEHKMVVWDDMNNLEPIRYYDKGVTASHYSSFGEFHMILRDGAITIPKVRLYESLMRQDQEFVDCIRSRRTPAASGDFAHTVVRVLEAAMKSLRNRGQFMAVEQA